MHEWSHNGNDAVNKFVSSVASVLEMGDVDLDFEFRTAPGWCSLQAFGLLVLLENDWGAPVSVEQLQRLNTVRDLYREAFVAFAAGIFKVPRQSLSGATEYGTIPEWDSVAHIKLAMEAERRFGVSYDIGKIPFMKRLDDFLA